MNYISGKGNTNKYKCALLFWLSCEYTLSMTYEFYKIRAYIYPKSYIYAKAPPQFFLFFKRKGEGIFSCIHYIRVGEWDTRRLIRSSRPT